MTKDRRLGKGLAALLGTPLEETAVGNGSQSPDSDSAGKSVGSAKSTTAAKPKSVVRKVPLKPDSQDKAESGL